jgi:hypothetical protein
MVVCMSRRICEELYKIIRKLRPAWHHDDDDKGVMKIVLGGDIPFLPWRLLWPSLSHFSDVHCFTR